VLPETVFYDCERLDDGDLSIAGLRAPAMRVPVTGTALESASALGSGSRVIATFRQRWFEPSALRSAEVALYLHEVSDPGNVGAVLRSAIALAEAVVVLSPRSADPFGPKAVRASMGAVFGQPAVRAELDALRAALEPGWRTVALVPGSGRPLHELERRRRTLYCLGSERLGLPPALVDGCDEVAHVPLRRGGAESLNVAMTATICLYETSLHRLSGR
jgi:TrmH family RNA methyltransferase